MRCQEVLLSKAHHYQDLIDIFNACFMQAYQTQLVKGDDEPLYLPADQQRPYHTIYFAHGFFSSALHECAHWCIAGVERRQLVDYGYWYKPDGRNTEEQQLFQQVEVKPQALECIFSHAAGHPFRVSVDNLNGEPIDEKGFAKAVNEQVNWYRANGLPRRAACFSKALREFYGVSEPLIVNQNSVCVV